MLKAADKLIAQISPKQELTLRAKGYAVVPDGLSFAHPRYEQLLVLDLQNNSITEITSEFCQNFPCLERLDLRNNKIKTISPHIKALMSLTTLRLDFNQLTQLTPQIGGLKLLEELSLEGNRLFEVPACLGENLT